VKTRTLLLLAVTCGLAILLAGGIQLLRVANQQSPAKPLAIGQSAKVGDATVTVDAVDTSDAELTVTIRVSGVDDGNGGAGFTLVTDQPMAPVDNDCTAFTVAERRCQMRFALGATRSQARVLVFSRATELIRWNLNVPAARP